MIGPGKYDDLCTYVREQSGVTDKGGTIVIVIGGNKGSGFSVQADYQTTFHLADILEDIVKQLRADVAG
jgi:hypothetical protein